eukprot:5708324-Amphidinium_carterae.1
MLPEPTRQCTKGVINFQYPSPQPLSNYLEGADVTCHVSFDMSRKASGTAHFAHGTPVRGDSNLHKKEAW